MFGYQNLDYDFPPYRPPNESGSALIRATRGCPWNRCQFCTMYKDMKFESKSVEETFDDIEMAAKIYANCDTIFLADSDSLVTKDIDKVIRRIRLKLPWAKRLTSYARARTLRKLGLKRLKKIKEAGLDRVHIGLESGDDQTLEFMDKGATAQEMIAGGKLAKEAGLEVSFYILIGAGGPQRLEEHAKGSAMVCNEVNPDFIRLRTLIVQKGSLLDKRRKAGEYTVTSPMEKLKEVRLFLQDLEVEDTEFASDHHTNNIWIDGDPIYRGIYGHLPEDKKKMLAVLDNAIWAIDSTDGEVLDATILYDRGFIRGL